MSFSENLIRLQAERHETNYRLAKELSVHPTTIRNWRDGKRPQLEHAAKVAAHFGLNLEEILN